MASRTCWNVPHRQMLVMVLSMVAIFLPTAAETGITHERVALPSRCTVHAPQTAAPHPYLVPVRPTCSRIAQSSGVLGSTFTSLVLPLIVRRGIAPPL